MYSREELDLIWEDYEKKYPCLACHDRPPTLYVKGESAPNWNKPLSDEEVLEVFNQFEKQLKVHEKMIPYSLMAINGIIDNELWSKIYKSLRESFGN